MNGTTPLLTLRFQELVTQVCSAPEADWVVNLSLPIAPATLARDVLRHTPPSPLEIEQAIERVEDAVMPARALAPGICAAGGRRAVARDGGRRPWQRAANRCARLAQRPGR